MHTGRIYCDIAQGVESITLSVITVRSIWHNSAADFFYVLENLHGKFPNLVAPPTDVTTQRLVLCEGLQMA